MDRPNGKEKIIRSKKAQKTQKFWILTDLFLALFLFIGINCDAATLKLVDTPLSQIIELYSKETGRNVFVDESVQTQRKVTAQLQGMGIEAAFDIIQKTVGLESCLISSETLLLYPPERSQRYRPQMKPMIMRIPAGIDPKWVVQIMGVLVPAIKTALSAGDGRAMVVFGPETQVNDARAIARSLPEIAAERRIISMSEAEAKAAFQDNKADGIEIEATSTGLVCRGSKSALDVFAQNVLLWRKSIIWGSDVFTPENLEIQKAGKAAEAAKGRAVIADLGNTGSILIEGPKADREKIGEIMQKLDHQARKKMKEIRLGELKPEAAKEALKGSGLGVEGTGDRRLVLVGKTNAIEDAADLLDSLGKKRHQVLVSFRLAEVSRSRLKNLGIDLDKTIYGYDEIKSFHPKDTLPLLLRAMQEGKDAKILAEPNLRVLEGEEAKVTVGDRIPLEVAATAQTDSGSTLKLQTQLNWIDVGIKMTAKNVAVNPDQSIRMAIKSEVSSVVSYTKQGYPQIRTREAESNLRLNNGGSVIMGGLLSIEDRNGQNRIPILSSIPLVGEFARSRDRQKIQTEIIMIVTAKLVEE